MSGIKVKICGLKDIAAIDAAIDHGADFIGLVFFPGSPRHVTLEEAAGLARHIKSRSVAKKVMTVALLVDADDALLEQVLGTVSPDMIQLHGSETPERVGAVKERTKIPFIKALAVSCESDFNSVQAYEAVADWLLFDAKPAPDGLPGGTGKTFDWSLLKGRRFSKPWMLSGGLTPETVGGALGLLSPNAVDVSSGVEVARGVKDPSKIRAFLEAAKGFSA
jgi:phosphoribosylanthranilate isomerase